MTVIEVDAFASVFIHQQRQHVRLNQRQQALRLRIAHADIEFQQFRPVCGQHDAGEQKTIKRAVLVIECRQRRLYNLLLYLMLQR